MKHADNPVKDLDEAAIIPLVDQYIKKADWKVKENSNMSFSLQGMQNYISSQVTEMYWLNSVYNEEIRSTYLRGDFHIHDLNSLSTYCVGWSLQDLMLEGFRGVHGKSESAPPKHFRSALGQVVNFLYTLQGESAGAQAFSDFDVYLAPFIRYDKLTDEQISQALQEFIFNMNVSTRVGFQTPFTNITLSLKPPAHLKDHPVIYGGKLQKECYGEFQEEMNRFNKALFDLFIAGDAKGRPFTFPIPTYSITKDFDWDNPVLEGLWKMAGKYGIPYFSNFVNSGMSPDDARSMCCRLRIDNTKLRLRGGGLFGSHPLTGSIGVVTINLPRLGYLAKTEVEFKQRLKKLMDVAKDSLEIKRAQLEKFMDKGLYPYSKFYLRAIKEHAGAYWVNHFSTIGIIGMNEAILNFMGKDIGTSEGRDFAHNILDFMRDVLVEYQNTTGNPYNLEATPGEGASYRFAKRDKELYPDIIVANETDVRKHNAAPFYTNSTHLPVNYTDDIFELLELQDDLQQKYTGGTVLHFFLGERIDNTNVIKRLVRKICDNYKLPYFSLTPTFSVCPSHGYIPREESVCPECGSRCEVYSRVVGYLRPVDQWNAGKQSEFRMRQYFAVDNEEKA